MVKYNKKGKGTKLPGKRGRGTKLPGKKGRGKKGGARPSLSQMKRLRSVRSQHRPTGFKMAWRGTAPRVNRSSSLTTGRNLPTAAHSMSMAPMPTSFVR